MPSDTEKYYKDAEVHYDHVTDAWKDFMGDHFHFGYYETEDTEQSKAVEALADKMLALCNPSEKSRVLDVGCGIGGPAFYVYEKCKCSIDGISTSSRGVELANAASKEKGYDEKVKFTVADGCDNGFPDDTFDVVWVMESSHLIQDKRKLFQECLRVMKEDGTLVLCDLMSLVLLPFPMKFIKQLTMLKSYGLLARAFGPAQVTEPGTYTNLMVAAGFHEITYFDISKEATPTMKSWKNNAIKFTENRRLTTEREYVDDFMDACDILEGLFKGGSYGYGIVRAVK